MDKPDVSVCHLGSWFCCMISFVRRCPAQGIPWWPSGWDFTLPFVGAWVRSLVRELRSSSHTVWPIKKERKKMSRFSLIISKILSLGDDDYSSTVMSRGVSHWNPSLISDHCEPPSCQIPDTCPSQINMRVNLDDSLCKGLSMVPRTIASTQYIFAVTV